VQTWASAKILTGGKNGHFAYSFQVADDAMQLDVQKTHYPSCTTKKMPYVTTTVTKIALR